MGPDNQVVEQIQTTLREHVVANYTEGSRTLALEPEDELLDSGIVDSLGVIELTSFLGEKFGVDVEADEIVPDNFGSVGAIARYVARKKGIEVEDPSVAGVRSLVMETVPADAVVLVVSFGDDALLSLDGRIGWHFPRDERGDHFPGKPADGAEAIAQLEALRSLGATHVVFPEPALWWLDEYAGLRDYLEGRSGEIGRSEAGVVYALP